MNEDPFPKERIVSAIQAFLDYGESSYVEDKPIDVPGHGGIFSGNGWAARCLRHHLKQLENSEAHEDKAFNDALESMASLAHERGLLQAAMATLNQSTRPETQELMSKLREGMDECDDMIDKIRMHYG